MNIKEARLITQLNHVIGLYEIATVKRDELIKDLFEDIEYHKKENDMQHELIIKQRQLIKDLKALQLLRGSHETTKTAH